MSGMTVPELSQQIDLCPTTIRSYIKAYNEKGIENLHPKKQPGRPPKVGHLSRDEASEILSRTHNRYEKLETDSRQWTIELLAGYAKEYLNESVTLDTISKALRGW